MSLPPLDLPAADAAEGWVRDRAADGLQRARDLVATLRSDPPTDPLGVLRAWDTVSLEISRVAAVGSLFSNVHPDEGVRTAAEDSETDAMRLVTELSLDKSLYDAFAGLSDDGLDPTAARLLAKVRRDFERSGVDQDDEVRARITEINERLTTIDQQFGKVIRDDVRSIEVTPDRLAGLPADWLEEHPVGDDGLVTVTTDYPDSLPVRMFAHDEAVRRELTVAFLNRGWPQTEPLLRELFDLRHELATLVGYPDWPSFDADVKMIGDGPAIPAFIDRIVEAAAEPMRRDLEALLERVRRDRPEATTIDSADAPYYEELVRQERFDVDSQRTRTYFDFAKVRQGLLDVTGRLFGLRYVEVPDASTWHDEVTTYDVVDVAGELGESGEPFARIHLDLHPRAGKYKHAAQFTLADGVLGRQLPEGVLVCNFSRGLMEHDHVVTLFHEFGHLLHHILAGRGEWVRFAGVATEWDFVEAPSQMLEEWAWDPDILAGFATDKGGEPIPAELVRKMKAADDFGKGTYARTQMFYAAMSYWFHQERPADLTARMVELQEASAAYPYIADTHMFASFGHLAGYSSSYYTYMWSLVIAKDLFAAFDADDLFAPEVAQRYRDAVLVPGGSGDAADLVADFLGRPYSFDAYAAWLSR